VFHDTRDRFGGSQTDTRFLAPLFPCDVVTRLVGGRGRFLPTAPDTIEPLTPLSHLPLPRSGWAAFAVLDELALASSRLQREEDAETAVTNLS
jgi:hypothetical protein